MKALILAAGYATRLYPLTKDYPKPLLKVGHKPIIDYIVDKIEGLDGIDEIIVVTNSKFMPLFRKWKLGLKIKKRISLVDDLTKSHADRRGAIGDMNFAISKKHLKESLLVVGGDNLFDADLKDFFSFVKSNPHPVIGVYDIRQRQQAKKYGVVKLDAESRLIDFKEKPHKPQSTLIAMCLYYFPKEKIGLIGEYFSNKADKHDATGFYIDWLRKRVPVYGFVFDGRWYDIGDHKFYHEANKKFA
ncbi:MAG: nucleotidyltransferase family protein [Candidatus Omnitrophica bacterium]|nr:nucleotidyltransferase family protein [Candidatus Omnitrophota bacterium]MDD5592894.1 nucleotidyltransferase family protein [Candidatus Omnitrophota bacterium]